MEQHHVSTKTKLVALFLLFISCLGIIYMCLDFSVVSKNFSGTILLFFYFFSGIRLIKGIKGARSLAIASLVILFFRSAFCDAYCIVPVEWVIRPVVYAVVLVIFLFDSKKVTRDSFSEVERDTAAESSKMSFPGVTKVIGWEMIILGVSFLIYAIWRVVENMRICRLYPNICHILVDNRFPYFLFIFGFLIIVFSIFLLKRKRWAWFASFVSIIIVGTLGLLAAFFMFFVGGRTMSWKFENTLIVNFAIIIGFISVATPIFFFKDRKNFFKIAD